MDRTFICSLQAERCNVIMDHVTFKVLRAERCNPIMDYALWSFEAKFVVSDRDTVRRLISIKSMLILCEYCVCALLSDCRRGVALLRRLILTCRPAVARRLFALFPLLFARLVLARLTVTLFSLIPFSRLNEKLFGLFN